MAVAFVSKTTLSVSKARKEHHSSYEDLLIECRPFGNTTVHGADVDEVEAVLSVTPVGIARIVDLESHIWRRPVRLYG